MSNFNLDRELFNCCRDGFLCDVHRLLAKGANVNSKFFNTALGIASQQGHFEIVRLLIDNGAELERKSDIGESPIFAAAQQGQNMIVELLAFRGASVHLQTLPTSGWTPLISASFLGHMSVIETLIAFGADIESAPKHSSMTALHYAVQGSRVNIVQLLLSLNADTTSVNVHRNAAVSNDIDQERVRQVLKDHEKKTDEERKQLYKSTIARVQHKVGVRLMRFAQSDIIGICLAFAPLELPPYVLLWIIDWLPNYDKLSHHKKIELITSVRNSIWKLK